MPLHTLIEGLGIRLVGATLAKDLARVVGSLTSLSNAARVHPGQCEGRWTRMLHIEDCVHCLAIRVNQTR